MLGRKFNRYGVLAIVAALGAVAMMGIATAGHTNTVLEARLDGRSEVAKDATNRRIVGDPNGTGEAYVFGIDGDPTTLCYVLTVDRIAPATAAHIHEAPAGQAGPVVITLAPPTGGQSAACASVSKALVKEIRQNPENYYVNVHNAEFPAGALRGQLAK